jgi:hypothetical protein
MTRSTVTLLILAMAGCYSGAGSDGGDDDQGEGGTVDDDDGDGTADDDAGDGTDTDAVACDETTAPRVALLRMHRTNYVHALESVFGTDAVAAIDATIGTLPAASSGMFATELPPVGFTEVSAYYSIANQLSLELTKDDASLAALSECLPAVAPGADAATDACLVALVEDYGKRILRRPLTDEDRARFVDDYAVGGVENVREGIATLLIGMLLDPRFLYFAEVDGEEIAPGLVELTDHELAARLARVLWDGIPDDELLAAAEAGLDDDTLAAQIERMLADDRARVAFTRFAGEWLALDVIPDPSATLFPDAAAREALRDDMKAELLRFMEGVAFDQEGSYADLLLDRSATVSTPELAEIYGVDQGDVVLPEERAGLLTRAGWLATNEVIRSNAGHIIKRGRRLGEFLCQPVPPPDPGNFPTEDPADPLTNPQQGIRERFLEAAAEPQCAGCHAILDGYGAPFGHYGATGQWIDVETIDVDGESVEIEIDASSTPVLDEQVTVDGAVALSEAIAASDVGPNCLATQLVRNVVARPVEQGDACLADAARSSLAPDEGEPGSLRDAIVRIVTSSHFRQVSIP